MDILDILKKKLAPVFPQAMAPPAMDTAQHDQVIAAGGDSLTMDSGGSGEAIGQAVGSGLMGMAQGGGQAAAPAPVTTEAGPLGQISDLNLRKPEAMPNFGSQAHGSSNMAPAAELPGIAQAPSAAVAPELLAGAGGGNILDALKFFPFGGARAYGGYVDPRKKYLVGENGPEMFVPEQPGQIVPNGDDIPMGTDHLPQSVEAGPIELGTQVTPRPLEPMPDDPKAQAQNPVAAMIQQPPPQPMTARQKLESERAEIEGKDYSIKKVVNPDGSTTKIRGKDRDDDHNILDVLKGIGWGAMRGAKAGGLEGMIAGAAMGGIQSGFDRNYDEKMLDEWNLSKNEGKLNTEREGELADAKIAEGQGKAVNEQQKYATDPYKNAETAMSADGVIDANESLILSSLRKRLGLIGDVQESDKRKVETKIINGEVWEREQDGVNKTWVKSNAPTDPTKAPVYTTSPMTGQQVAVTPQDLYSGESTMAAGNAQRQQAADTTNVTQDLEAQKANATALAGWHQRETKRKIDAIGEFGKTLENLGEVQTINAQIQKLQGELATLAANGDTEGFTAKEEEFKALAETFNTALKKTQAGTQLVEMLGKTAEPKPAAVAAKKVKSSQVSAKVVSQADLASFAKSQGWSVEQATAYAQKNGWQIK